ncbi:FGGY family carbohydrate kinase [Synechococcus sp. PCC 7336]|uniref:FGGY-family carbohydrate kinase n=1 Tax=Synechococcus sp. PCC 7336 TaxID=195250 RepID=UPI0003482FC8
MQFRSQAWQDKRIAATSDTVPVYLGFDFGTSGARAIAIHTDGSVRARACCAYSEAANSASGWQTTLYQLLARLPIPIRQQVRAIAIDATSSTTLACDRDGCPIAPVLLYNDGRAITWLPILQQVAPAHHVVLSATSGLAKLLWLGQQPDFDRARYCLSQADWLGHLLHGQLGVSDYHNCLKLGYDVAHSCFPNWLLSLEAGGRAIAPLLPRVVAPGTPIGSIRREVADRFQLPRDCAVCAGTTDSIAAFLASGAATAGEAVTSLGSTLAVKLLSAVRVDDSRYGIYSHRLGHLWLVGGASNTGGAVLRQFFSDRELVQLSDRIDPTLASPLDYYPLLQSGERFPSNDPALAPRLEPRPDRDVEFLHGLLESMARIEARGYGLLQQLGATPLQRVYTAGGGAANRTWTALRSRHLKVPVETAARAEAAYGAALLAMRGLD